MVSPPKLCNLPSILRPKCRQPKKAGEPAFLRRYCKLDTLPIEATVANGELPVTLPERRDRRGYDVNLAAYLPEASTAVGRGEE
jgi:hypothetical protein